MSDLEQVLKDDIDKRGQLVPILVRRLEQKHRYELIDGALRIKALLALGQDTVFANIVDAHGILEPGCQELPIIQVRGMSYCSWCPCPATKWLMHQPFCDECGKEFSRRISK